MYADQKIIYDAIDLALCTGEPLFIGRNGSTELGQMLGIPQHIQLLENAGIWPSADDFAEAAAEATRATDIVAAGWYAPLVALEDDFLRNTSSAIQVQLGALEPYYAPEHLQWSRLLAGQRVAVVSPFATTIEQQIKKPIWANGLLPTSIDLVTIRTGYSPQIGPNSWPPEVSNWKDAINLIVKQVEEAKVRVVLLGCGAIGMLIAHRLQQSGHICIVLGGALQILFGIKGRRWLNEPVAAHFNKHWCWPLERPSGAAIIEGGCYW